MMPSMVKDEFLEILESVLHHSWPLLLSVHWKHPWPSLGQSNGIIVSISVCQAGRPGSSLVRSVCFRNVEFYKNASNLFPPVPKTGSPKALHVLLCLYNNACKRSLAICRNSRALYPISRYLYSLHVLNRGVNMIQTKPFLAMLQS